MMMNEVVIERYLRGYTVKERKDSKQISHCFLRMIYFCYVMQRLISSTIKDPIIMVPSSAGLEMSLKNCEIITVKEVKNITLAIVLRCTMDPF